MPRRPKQLSERDQALLWVAEDYEGEQDVEFKKSLIIGLTREGYSTTEIHRAMKYSLAFVHDVIREFAHKCLVDEVKHG